MKIANVMSVQRDRYELLEENEVLKENEVFYGRLKKANFYSNQEFVEYPTVGDRVEIAKNEAGDSQILQVLPRKSVFMRQNATPGAPDQAVAANFDYVFITMSLNHDFHLTKLERYLTTAWQSGGTPVIILTKADVCEEAENYILQAEKEAIGVPVYAVSSKTGEGFEALEKYFTEGKTIVLLGSSGVGKSSFVNALFREKQMETGGIREADSQGRHTTTYKQCFYIPKEIVLPNGKVLQGGGRIIDTPGMRKLMMSDVEDGISTSFEDIETLAANCKFSDCQHGNEPGCAIRQALLDGTLDKRRYQTYVNLQREEAYSKERKQIMMKKIGKARKERRNAYVKN